MMASHGILWHHMASYGIAWHRMVQHCLKHDCGCSVDEVDITIIICHEVDSCNGRKLQAIMLYAIGINGFHLSTLAIPPLSTGTQKTARVRAVMLNTLPTRQHNMVGNKHPLHVLKNFQTWCFSDWTPGVFRNVSQSPCFRGCRFPIMGCGGRYCRHLHGLTCLYFTAAEEPGSGWTLYLSV